MVILILERSTASLRGEVTRWMIEPRPGVFAGRMSAMVRDKLWEHVCSRQKEGSSVMLYSSQTEQGFSVRSWGDPRRHVTEWEGLSLITKPRQEQDTSDDPEDASLISKNGGEQQAESPN